MPPAAKSKKGKENVPPSKTSRKSKTVEANDDEDDFALELDPAPKPKKRKPLVEKAPDSPKHKQTKNNSTVKFKEPSNEERERAVTEKDTRNESRESRKEKSNDSVVNDEERSTHEVPSRPHVRTREARSLNRLQAELDEARASVKQLTADYTHLRDYRETAPEAAMAELIATSETRFQTSQNLIMEYKKEIEILMQENTALRGGVPAVDRQTQAEIDDERKRWRERENRYKEEVEGLQRELAAETEHSKGLAAKLKPTPVVPAPAPVVAHTSSNYEDLKARAELSEELTGLLVRSVKEETTGKIFSCLIVDTRGKGRSFHFKLTFHPDNSCSYEPSSPLDEEVLNILDKRLRNYMRMDRQQVVRAFRMLWADINSVP